MSLAARAWSSEADGPFEIPAQVSRIRDITNWDAVLPAHAGTAAWRLQQGLKRGLDIALSASALLVLSPVFAVIAAVIKLKSPGPVFYEWRVLGRGAEPFTGYKFRTMVVDADELKARFMDRNEMSGPVFKMRDDPRITPLGRWLRKYSVDELPQLWSVLKGDMSLVGPRPPAPEEFVRFQEWQRGKLAVTPGITCLWQVSGRNEIRDFDTWAALDLEYIRTWSLWLDIRILARTIPAVLSGRGAY
jgi:lipopolysaccharide/colanic/teichoic acid biosynthesis glycosyltransferase